MELAIYFISGIQLTLLAILLYQYGSILKNYKLIQSNHKATTKSYEQWIKLTTEQLDTIKEHISTSDFADAATLNRDLNAFSARLNASETAVNTLAQKEATDVKTLQDSIKSIKIYLQSVIQDATSNKGY